MKEFLKEAQNIDKIILSFFIKGEKFSQFALFEVIE